MLLCSFSKKLFLADVADLKGTDTSSVSDYLKNWAKKLASISAGEYSYSKTYTKFLANGDCLVTSDEDG